jgi:hypothetical protein
MFSRTLVAAALCGIAALLIASFNTPVFATNVPVVATKLDANQQAREAGATKFVAQKLQVWQDRMNLKDWNIRVDLLRASQLEPQTLGNIHWDTDTKSATIGVLSPLDYSMAYQPMLKDMEFTIVHELVHLELASLPHSEASRRPEETAVNQLADALLRLAH